MRPGVRDEANLVKASCSGLGWLSRDDSRCGLEGGGTVLSRGYAFDWTT